MSRLRSMLFPGASLLIAALGGLAAHGAPRPRVPSATVEHAQRESVAPTPDLAWLSVAAAEANPFRRERLPVSPRYDVRREDSPAEVEQQPLRPAIPPPEWTLTGILWSLSPIAVFEGIDGDTQGKLVEPGEQIGEYVISLIARDSVVVSHPDTSWAFRVVEPWRGGGQP